MDVNAFRRPVRHHNCRRAPFHDYKAPGDYMITVNKAPETPDFSRLVGDPRSAIDPPRVALSNPGGVIADCIEEIAEEWPMFEIENYVVMPDHVHLLWRVKNWLPRDLGYYVGQFKSQCTAEIRRLFPAYEEMPVFMEKFNDRIAFNSDQSLRFSKYITDNPRRRLMVIRYPHLFSRAQRVRIKDREFDVYGNFQLLKHPQIAQAVVSRRYTDEEAARYAREQGEAIRGQGVFISPFISEDERKLRDAILEAGGSIIRIVADGFGPRYKPSGEEFDLCAEGRCLHLGVPRPSAHREELRRSFCLELNEIARWIASHPAETLKLIGGKAR